MRLVMTHSLWMIKELLRQPAYVVSSVAFPALFYAIFAIPEAKDKHSANLLLASFSCFAVFGVLFLQFGVSIAQERTKSWYHYLRTLPVHPIQLTLARFLSAYFFAGLSVLVLVILAYVYTPIELNSKIWFQFVSYLFLGGFIFCLMGLSLGYWTNEKSALALGNLIYLPLSFAGGLWKPPNILPEMLKDISIYLPTRQYGEILWQTVAGQSFETKSLNTLLIYLIVFTAIAWIGFKKDFNARMV